MVPQCLCLGFNLFSLMLYSMSGRGKVPTLQKWPRKTTTYPWSLIMWALNCCHCPLSHLCALPALWCLLGGLLAAQKIKHLTINSTKLLKQLEFARVPEILSQPQEAMRTQDLWHISRIGKKPLNWFYRRGAMGMWHEAEPALSLSQPALALQAGKDVLLFIQPTFIWICLSPLRLRQGMQTPDEEPN